METAKLFRFLGKQGGSNRRKIVSFPGDANEDTGNSPTPNTTMTCCPKEEDPLLDRRAPTLSLRDACTGAVETRFCHRSTDLGVRGSTPLGRANLFNGLLTRSKSHRGSHNYCGPFADPTSSRSRPRTLRGPKLVATGMGGVRARAGFRGY
jgi:hypothetical protein